MVTASITSCCYLWKSTMHKPLCHKHYQMVRKVYSLAREKAFVYGEELTEDFCKVLKRREALLLSGTGLVSMTVSGFSREGKAVMKQGLLAGRIPGLSEPDDQGWRTYRRPDEKSGGHGVGWSPIISYSFPVPQEWQEVIIHSL